LTPAAGPAIQTPVYAAPQRVGWLELAGPALDFGVSTSTTATLTLTGVLADGAFPPTQTVALMGLFALQQASPPIAAGPNCEPPGQVAAADLRYVGVAGPLDGTIAFAIAAYGPWSSPQEVIFTIELDVDGDAATDYRLANRDTGYLNPFSTGDTDEFIGVLEEIGTVLRLDQGPLNTYSPAVYDTRLLNTDVMVIPLRVADLDTAAAQIRYRVVTYISDLSLAAELGNEVDRTPWHTLDLARPNGLSAVGWTRALLPAAGAPAAVAFDRTAASVAGVNGLLALHLHNPMGLRAQVLPIAYTWPYTMRLPWYQSSRP
jgi:hypothetical protein